MFKAEDKVRLASGGPEMSVSELHGTECICTWYDDENVFQIDAFEQDSLVGTQPVAEETQPVAEETQVTNIGPIGEQGAIGPSGCPKGVSSPEGFDDVTCTDEVEDVQEVEAVAIMPTITPCRCVNTCPTGFCTSSYKGGISHNY